MLLLLLLLLLSLHCTVYRSFYPISISSTPSVRPDSSSQRDTEMTWSQTARQRNRQIIAIEIKANKSGAKDPGTKTQQKQAKQEHKSCTNGTSNTFHEIVRLFTCHHLTHPVFLSSLFLVKRFFSLLFHSFESTRLSASNKPANPVSLPPCLLLSKRFSRYSFRFFNFFLSFADETTAPKGPRREEPEGPPPDPPQGDRVGRDEVLEGGHGVAVFRGDAQLKRTEQQVRH